MPKSVAEVGRLELFTTMAMFDYKIIAITITIAIIAIVIIIITAIIITTIII